MMIICCDFHPRFQQISFLREETGECGQGRKANGDSNVFQFGGGESKDDCMTASAPST